MSLHHENTTTSLPDLLDRPSLRHTAQLPYNSWACNIELFYFFNIVAQTFNIRLMLFIDCHDL